MYLQSILFLSFIQGDLLVPDEGRQRFVQEVHLPHEDVRGLRSLRYLLHEVQIRLNNPEKMEVRSDRIDQEPVLWIRIRSDPKLVAGSGLGSGINNFGSGSGQSGSGMNLIPNFSVKK
jgi:hypothetical protein